MPNPQQLKKLEKLAKVIDSGDLVLLEELNALEDRLEGLETIVPALREAEDGEKGEKGERGDDGKDGQDYILTEQDKQEIAQSILVPVVEKVIERTETIIKEKPIVTNEIVEVAVINPDELPQYGERYRDGLELLQGDERLDISAVKGIDERDGKISDALTERTISIVDNRTSFLITKINNLQDIDFISTRNGTITRSGNYISTVALTGGRTLTVSRDVNNYISTITDGTRTWTYTRNGSNQITSWLIT